MEDHGRLILVLEEDLVCDVEDNGDDHDSGEDDCDLRRSS